MATVDMVLDTLTQTIQTALNALTPTPAYKGERGFPQPEELEADIAQQICHVSVYPNAMGEQNTTRVIDRMQQITAPVVTLGATLSGRKLQGGTASAPATGTITLTGSIGSGIVTIFEIGPQGGLVYVAYDPAAGLTLAAAATGLAAAINADSNASTLVSATASAATVTITAKTNGVAQNAWHLGFQIGGTGVIGAESGRRRADFTIHVWAYDDTSRGILSNQIDQALSQTPWLFLADGSAGRLRYIRTIQTDLEIKHGIYRRVLHYTVEYVSLRQVSAVQVLENLVTLTPTPTPVPPPVQGGV